ncbi:DUF6455 family protein [Phaeobacter sp. QD34_3]|uniref:DUF6455 family protein n=1 Tax=unclassified Phaeobacter TaxID=2621772 RepID=UPI00237F93EF|nr:MULTISPECIES: DUF6455 family protein [unclassified Phaeobacter]MDE4134206.1 DUF6455 family protein [Phaeobacter sp. QD34_3]MDE4137871.1 DUF6455 family protein [Phaeobacter sp. QD34_24]
MTKTATKIRPKPGYLSKSIGLLSSTARASGIDLGSAMKQGKITAVDYARMVHTCNSSDCALKCQNWRQSEEGRRDPPPFCPNLDILKRLKS